MPLPRPRLFGRFASSFKSSSAKREQNRKPTTAAVRRAAVFASEMLETRWMFAVVTTPQNYVDANGITQDAKELLGIYAGIRIDGLETPVETVEGHYIEISQGGDTSTNYQGAYLDENGDAQLAELPITLVDPATDDVVEQINGGAGGAGGTQLYGQEQITDPINPALNTIFSAATGAGVTINALGADTTPGNVGVLYGLDVVTSGSAPVVQLIEFPNSTNQNASTGSPAVSPAPRRGDGIVIAHLEQTINAGLAIDGSAAITNISAAAFDPIDNRLYFVVQANGPTLINQLFSVDVHAGNAVAITDSVLGGRADNTLSGTFSSRALVLANPVAGTVAVPSRTAEVSAIAFDQINADTADMYAAVTITDTPPPSQNNPAPGPVTGQYLVTYTAITNVGAPEPTAINTDAVPGAQQKVETSLPEFDDTSAGVGNVNDVVGLSVGSDGLGQSTYVYAITPGGTGTSDLFTDASLLRFNLSEITATTGQSEIPGIQIASLANPLPSSVFALGNDFQDFVWEPSAIDPITGALGAFVGTDAAAGELGVISISIRPPSSYLYAVQVSASDASSFITIAAPVHNEFFPSPDPLAVSGVMSPFLGDSGEVATESINGFTIVHAPGGTGLAYLGLRAIDGTPITQVVDPGTNETISAGFQVADDANGNPQDFGRFLFGGTVTGTISISGSIDTFYCGWLITGEATADINNLTDDTFAVGGDIDNIWVESDAGVGTIIETGNGSLPANGPYITDLTGTIGGHLGQFRVVGTLNDAITVSDDIVTGFNSDQVKLLDEEGSFEDGFLGGTGALTNNTFATPQYLGTLASTDATTAPLGSQVISLGGTLQDSFNAPHAIYKADYYAVGLLAGQTVTVELNVGTVNGLDIGIFDPDGRLIATDYSRDVGDGVYGNQTNGEPFQFTTDRPGAYRVAISYSGNTTFANATGPGDPDGDLPYLFTLQTVGNIAIGGIYSNVFTGSAEAENGDLGAMHCDTRVLDVSTIVDTGNLRDIDSADIGVLANNVISDPSFYSVPDGAIGLIRATDALAATGILLFEPLTTDPTTGVSTPVGTEIQTIDGVGTVECDLAANDDIGTVEAGNMATAEPSTFAVNPNDNPAIAGRIDLIDCLGDFGTAVTGGPAITTGPNGDVEFIHVGGEVFQDAFFGGGFQTTTIHDAGVPVTLTDDGGASITITPIGTVTANPAYNAANPIAGVPANFGPQVELTTYGIRGSGGVVIVNATVVGGSVDISSTGTSTSQVAEVTTVDVTGTGTAVIDQSAATTTTGTTTTTTTTTAAQTITPVLSPVLSTLIPPGSTTAPNTNIVPIETDPTSTTSLTVTLDGTNNLDVFDIVGGAFNSIINNTQGEIVNVQATSIGLLQSRGPIGVPHHADAAQIAPIAVVSNNYPFVQQHFGIVSGSIVQVISASAIGNLVVTGTIGEVIAGAGGAKFGSPGVGPNLNYASGTTGVYAGIDGPIFASGQIQEVIIGQGILPSGSGAVGLSGIFADGVIGTVTNSQPGAEIRGTIDSLDEINFVGLHNASIINATIGNTVLLADSDQLFQGFSIAEVSHTQETPFYELGAVSVSGDGGILGGYFESGDIGPVTVGNGGFGIFYSQFQLGGDGELAPVSASGYGIRGSLFEGGSTMASISATGNGGLISTDVYDPALFNSRTTNTYDPFFGLLPSRLTDLDAYLGTSDATPSIPDVTDTGVIEDTQAVGSRNLGSINAEKIREVTGQQLSLTTVFTSDPGTPEAFGTQFNFGNSIGRITVRSGIDGMELTTGKLGAFSSPSVDRMGITIAGTLNGLTIHGNYGEPEGTPVGNVPTGDNAVTGDSFIQAVGPHGFIKNLTIFGDLNASVLATSGIGNITVTGNLLGTVTDTGTNRGLALGTLRVGGELQAGQLRVTGSVGSIIISGGLGTPATDLTGDVVANSITVTGLASTAALYVNEPIFGDGIPTGTVIASILSATSITLSNVPTIGNAAALLVARSSLTISGNANLISIGANHKLKGSDLALDLTVAGTLRKLLAFGQITGNVTVDGGLTNMTVQGDGTEANIVTGNINVLGGIGSADLINGSLASDITTNGSIGRFTFTRGDLAAGAALQSDASIQSFIITGGATYGLFGTLTAPSGNIASINVSGNVGDGTDAASVIAKTGGNFNVLGSITSPATIALTTSLNSLNVRGNVESGVTISAHPLKKIKVFGANQGTITQT